MHSETCRHQESVSQTAFPGTLLETYLLCGFGNPRTHICPPITCLFTRSWDTQAQGDHFNFPRLLFTQEEKMAHVQLGRLPWG